MPPPVFLSERTHKCLETLHRALHTQIHRNIDSGGFVYGARDADFHSICACAGSERRGERSLKRGPGRIC